MKTGENTQYNNNEPSKHFDFAFPGRKTRDGALGTHAQKIRTGYSKTIIIRKNVT